MHRNKTTTSADVRIAMLLHKIVMNGAFRGQISRAASASFRVLAARMSSSGSDEVGVVAAHMLALVRCVQKHSLLVPAADKTTHGDGGGGGGGAPPPPLLLDGHHDWIAAKVSAWLLKQEGRGIAALVDIGGGRGDMARLVGGALGLGREACVCVEQTPADAVWDADYDFGVNAEQVTFCWWSSRATDRIALPDASADLVLIMVALHHMTPAAAAAAVANARRILRPGGRLLLKEHDIVTPADRCAVDWEHHIYHVMDAFPRPLDETQIRAYLDAEYVGNFRPKLAWNELLRGCGFVLEHDMTRTFDEVAEETPKDDRNATGLYWQVWRVCE